jgi:hypothetical protein
MAINVRFQGGFNSPGADTDINKHGPVPAFFNMILNELQPFFSFIKHAYNRYRHFLTPEIWIPPKLYKI